MPSLRTIPSPFAPGIFFYGFVLPCRCACDSPLFRPLLRSFPSCVFFNKKFLRSPLMCQYINYIIYHTGVLLLYCTVHTWKVHVEVWHDYDVWEKQRHSSRLRRQQPGVLLLQRREETFQGEGFWPRSVACIWLFFKKRNKCNERVEAYGPFCGVWVCELFYK